MDIAEPGDRLVQPVRLAVRSDVGVAQVEGGGFVAGGIGQTEALMPVIDGAIRPTAVVERQRYHRLALPALAQWPAVTQDELAALAVHQQGLATLPSAGEVVALLERHLPAPAAAAARGDGRQTEQCVDGMVPAVADQHRLAGSIRVRGIGPRQTGATDPQRPDERQRRRGDRARALVLPHGIRCPGRARAAGARRCGGRCRTPG